MIPCMFKIVYTEYIITWGILQFPKMFTRTHSILAIIQTTYPDFLRKFISKFPNNDKIKANIDNILIIK